MTFASGFRGTSMGSVQTSYTDQPGQAVAGMEAFASDNNAKDSIFIGETNGIACGRGIVTAQVAEAAYKMQLPNIEAYLPIGSEDATDFAGILMFDEACQSDENGVPGWAAGRQGRYMRPQRSGGRIWVKAVEAIDPQTASVNWVVTAPADASYALGEFSPAALGGGAAGVSVALTNCKWITAADAGGLAIIEMVGAIVGVTPTDESSF